MQASDWVAEINNSVPNADQKGATARLMGQPFSAAVQEMHYLAKSQRRRVSATGNCFRK
jgi:hypothetical protein